MAKAQKTEPKDTTTEVTKIVVRRPAIGYIEIPIVGIEPLILHAWSAKAKQKMLAAQQKEAGSKAKVAKEPRDPHADYLGARYIFRDGDVEWDGCPATAFKAAMVGACRMVSGLPMTEARRMLFVKGDGVIACHSPLSTAATVDLVRIYGEPQMREDAVRIDNGKSTDLAYRPQYFPWSAVLKVEFNASMIKPDAVVNLVATAGYFEGVGEWRPGSKSSNSGQLGRWELDEAKMG